MKRSLTKLRSAMTTLRLLRVGGGVMVGLILFGLYGELRPYVRRSSKPTDESVTVTVDKALASGDELYLSYSVTNYTSDPVLVFDQMVGPRFPDSQYPYGEPNETWAFVDFEPDGWSLHGRAYKLILSRRIEHMSGTVCNSPMPYAHSLGAGETLHGSFRVPWPLKERSGVSRDTEPRVEGKPFDEMVYLRDFVLEIGWSPERPPDPVPDKQMMTTFSYKDQTLWYFTPGGYYWLEPTQQIARSSSRPVRWHGLLH